MKFGHRGLGGPAGLSLLFHSYDGFECWYAVQELARFVHGREPGWICSELWVAALRRVDGWGMEVSGGAWGGRALRWPGEVGVVAVEVPLAALLVLHPLFQFSPPIVPQGGWEHCPPSGTGVADAA